MRSWSCFACVASLCVLLCGVSQLDTDRPELLTKVGKTPQSQSCHCPSPCLCWQLLLRAHFSLQKKKNQESPTLFISLYFETLLAFDVFLQTLSLKVRPSFAFKKHNLPHSCNSLWWKRRRRVLGLDSSSFLKSATRLSSDCPDNSEETLDGRQNTRTISVFWSVCVGEESITL